MKAAFVLLVDTTGHSFMRRLAVDINERYWSQVHHPNLKP